MISDYRLVQKLRELCSSGATLLWLEGSRHQRVVSVKLQGMRIILGVSDGTSRVVAFERYAITAVGLQFWNQGHPGVLYRWDHVPADLWSEDLNIQDTSEAVRPPDTAA